MWHMPLPPERQRIHAQELLGIGQHFMKGLLTCFAAKQSHLLSQGSQVWEVSLCARFQWARPQDNTCKVWSLRDSIIDSKTRVTRICWSNVLVKVSLICSENACARALGYIGWRRKTRRLLLFTWLRQVAESPCTGKTSLQPECISSRKCFASWLPLPQFPAWFCLQSLQAQLNTIFWRQIWIRLVIFELVCCESICMSRKLFVKENERSIETKVDETSSPQYTIWVVACLSRSAFGALLQQPFVLLPLHWRSRDQGILFLILSARRHEFPCWCQQQLGLES